MQTSTITSLIEVVASAQIHGGTRVVVMTASEPHPHHFVVETTAYDSNHPDEQMGHGVFSGPDLASLVTEVREYESRTFEIPQDPTLCDCWITWDPYCGSRGCWGVYKTEEQHQ